MCDDNTIEINTKQQQQKIVRNAVIITIVQNWDRQTISRVSNASFIVIYLLLITVVDHDDDDDDDDDTQNKIT